MNFTSFRRDITIKTCLLIGALQYELSTMESEAIQAGSYRVDLLRAVIR